VPLRNYKGSCVIQLHFNNISLSITHTYWHLLIGLLICLSTAIGLTPGGSTHLHINNTQNITINNKTTWITNKTTQITNLEECWPCPVFANYTPAFALQLREKHGKTSVRVAKEIQSIHINKTPAHYKTHPHTHTHTHTHITKQFKTTIVQIKTNTVRDISKWNNDNIIKFPQYKANINLTLKVPLILRCLQQTR
jgi:hypothetical protein